MSTKALQMAKELQDVLKSRKISTLPVVTESYDASGFMVITMSADATPATGEKVVVIRVKPISWPNTTDVLGLASQVYTPSVIQICTEANFAGTTDNVADILSPIELLPILATCALRGAKVEWHVIANGTVPSVAAIDAGTNLKSSFDMHFQWGMKASS